MRCRSFLYKIVKGGWRRGVILLFFYFFFATFNGSRILPDLTVWYLFTFFCGLCVFVFLFFFSKAEKESFFQKKFVTVGQFLCNQLNEMQIPLQLGRGTVISKKWNVGGWWNKQCLFFDDNNDQSVRDGRKSKKVEEEFLF